MTDQYTRELLRVAVAQVCQTIGYHTIQATPMELLQDTVHKFLHEFSRDLRRQVEHYNRTEANLNDTFLTFNNLNIKIHELLDYINNVQPMSLAVEVPKFPAYKSTNLNFLKPGSREVLTRPVHIYEYLPPMLPTDSYNTLPAHYTQDKYRGNLLAVCDSSQNTNPEQYLTGNLGGSPSHEGGVISDLSPICLKSTSISYDEEGRPTREISSVVMTTGGFISPAIEGKLPDTRVPKFVEKLLGLDAPPPATPPTPLIEGNLGKENNHQNKSASSKVDVKENTVCQSSQASKTLTNISKPSIPDASISYINPPLAYTSKDSILSKNTTVSNLVSTSPSKKPVPNHLTEHNLPEPTLASKLLKKARKKNTQNLQNPLSAKFPRTDLQNSETSLVVTDAETSEKIQRKNKKILQKLLKTGVDSSAPDQFNIVHRLKIEKFLKKQSKHHKKMMHKQKNNSESNILDAAIDVAKLHENVPSLSVPSNIPINSANSYVTEIVPSQFVSQNTVPTSLPKPEFTQTISALSQPLIIEKGVSNSIHEISPDNRKMSSNVFMGHDNKALSGVKLPAELDKNKLNIFKKISKQKAQKSLSPNMSRMASQQMYSGNEGTFLNLPCGTTITPSPPTPSPPTPNRLTPGDTLAVISEMLDKPLNLPVNSDIRGALDLASAVMPGVLNTPPQVNKPKKRGRKLGSKNLPKQLILSPLNPSQVTQQKKMKKLKTTKHTDSYPPLDLEPSTSLASRMQLKKKAEGFSPALAHGEDFVPTNLSTNAKKERKKGKMKNQPINMSTSEQNVFKLEALGPTKEEVSTINRKLLRMDTVLQPLGAFDEAMLETDKDFAKTFSTKIIHTQKPFSTAKRPASLMPIHHQPNSSLMPGLHPNMFMSTSGLGRIPNMLNLYTFPPGPGLIPPTAQNLLFPRLPSTFQLPIPSFRQQSAERVINPEPVACGEITDSLLLQPSAERSYCNVPPFVPESMKLTPPESKVDIQKFERENQKSAKHQQSPDKILKNADTWGISENACKSVATVSGGISHASEAQKPIDRSIKSPKTNIKSPVFVGSLYSQNPSPNKILAKSGMAPVLNSDDPIELSDDSIEYPPPPVFSSLNAQDLKDFHQNQHQLTAPSVNFPCMDDLLFPTCNEPVKEAPVDLNLISREFKKSKKSNKIAKSTKTSYQNHNSDMSSIDLFSSEKGGVGKLAGGADLIPLISTGSAYSSKTTPSTSLTATVAAPFALPNTDFSPANAFDKSLLSANVDDNVILSMTTEPQKKKKEHKRLKKLKDEKSKKKKDKKSKNKDRSERSEKVPHKSDKHSREKSKETLRREEEQQIVNKDLLRKLKKEKKKKYKQLIAGATEPTAIHSPSPCVENSATIFSMGNTTSIFSSTTSSTTFAPSFVPKLTLKLGSGQSPTLVDDTVKKHVSTVAGPASIDFGKKREPSPELARISPLVTRTAKQKFSIAETVTTSSLHCNQLASVTPSGSNTNSAFDILAEHSANPVIPPISSSGHSVVPPPSPWSSGGTISASSVLLPQQLLQSTKTHEQLGLINKAEGGLLANTIAGNTRPLTATARQSPVPLISETSRPSSYIDAEGNRVWICPACGKVDDGSPMIGCDGCDAWYHWVCVGISVAPKENEDWFCRVCITRKKGIHATDKKRKRNKKK